MTVAVGTYTFAVAGTHRGYDRHADSYQQDAGQNSHFDALKQELT
jgi:hypothetical protein